MTRLQFVNRQRHDRVPLAWLARLARRAAAKLKIHARGQIAVTFIDSPTMRKLNRKFTGHRGLTDVLCFRYPSLRSGLRVPLVGEILVAPEAARRYADAHGIPYRQELARYVVHGLLHWLGHEDRTEAEQRRMRSMEDRLLAACAD